MQKQLCKFYFKLKLKKKTGSSKNKDKIYNSLLKNFIKSEKGTITKTNREIIITAESRNSG